VGDAVRPAEAPVRRDGDAANRSGYGRETPFVPRAVR
jgi:hypothetical protein